jgi:Tol biopolymer transport system component
VLPGGNGVVFTIWSTTVHTAKLAVIDLRSGHIRELVDGASAARYAADGRLIYSYAGSLVAAPFDPRGLEIKGSPSIVLEGVTAGVRYGEAHYAIASNGTVVYLPEHPETARRELVSWTEGESFTSLSFEPRFYRNMKVDAVGRRLALTVLDGSRSDVWIAAIEQGTLSRLTFEGFNIEPVWSPDGQWVSFASNREGPYNIYRKKADGSGPAERLLRSERHQYPQSWTRDGRKVLFTEHHPETGFDLWLLDLMEKERNEDPLQPLLVTTADEFGACLSPDGRWLSYASNESGRWEVYVQPFPSEGGKWQVSAEGGHGPLWSADGRHILYEDGDRIFHVPFQPGTETPMGTARVLLERDDLVTVRSHPLDDRLMMVKELEEHDPLQEVHVILDWFDPSRGAER